MGPGFESQRDHTKKPKDIYPSAFLFLCIFVKFQIILSDKILLKVDGIRFNRKSPRDLADFTSKFV